MSTCPELPEPIAPLTLRLEGLKLGQRALYSCPLGYSIEGVPNSTCLASGNWSSPPPTCNPVQCPPLFLEDPHLSLTELNTSAWGRAVFKCSWGYRLSGPPGLECEPSGSWSGPVPRCRGKFALVHTKMNKITIFPFNSQPYNVHSHSCPSTVGSTELAYQVVISGMRLEHWLRSAVTKVIC